MATPRTKDCGERATSAAETSAHSTKLSQLLAALPPLAADAFPDEIPDAPPDLVESS
jgi:hypothetical protein